MKVMIMAGGTGGHVFPALALATELVARGVEVVWIGTRAGLEARVVPAAGYPMEWINIAGLRGGSAQSWLGAPLLLLRAVVQALAAIRRQRPQLVVGMGGFASGPGGLAARLLRRPLLVHEQNAVAGLTNRLLARLADVVLEAFPGTFAVARHAQAVGNPVRAEIAALAPPHERIRQHSPALRLLVLGGSQGARALNLGVPAAIACLAADVRPQVWHQAGRTIDDARAAYAGLDIELSLAPFIQDMAAAYGWADLVVCRAGALTIAELAAAGVAAILVPYPSAVDDHQTRNARYLVDAGAAILMPATRISGERLSAVLCELSGDRRRLLRMAEAARGQAWPRATQNIADRCLQTVGAAP